MTAIARQQGLATLTFTVMLLFAITSVSFLTAKTILTDQKVAANEYRAKEITYTSEAALEYGLGWLNDNQPDFATWDASDEDGDGLNFNDLDAPNTSINAGVDGYTLTVDYQRRCIAPDSNTVDDDCEQWLIHMTATTSANSDNNLGRTQVIRVLEDLSNFPASIGYIRVPGSWQDW